jgi:hypothetical protein
MVIDAQTFTAVASGDAGIKGGGNVEVKTEHLGCLRIDRSLPSV